MSQFERDEFDEVATQRGPVGVHRKKRSALTPWFTAVAVFVVAGGLAYGTAVYLWQSSGGEGLPPVGDVPVATQTQTVVATPTDELPTQSATPTPSETPSPTPTAEPVHHEAAVAVLNGAGVSGLAGRNADVLKGAGYTATTAGNISANKPAANVVRYADPLYETTARDVARLLGIDAVERGVTPQGSVAVLLVTDPSK